jgi:hypothetical protein
MCGPHHKGAATWPRQGQHTKSWELVSRADHLIRYDLLHVWATPQGCSHLAQAGPTH